MENLNPGGTGKDRAAFYMVKSLLRKRGIDLISGSVDPSRRIPIVEGTSGSTGIALASICNAMGLPLYIFMPDDQAAEKRIILETLGAQVKIVPSCSIANKEHYVNQARLLAQELGGVFVDQFENEANYRAHIEMTGPEIYSQMGGRIDAFVMASGTGGTIAGVSK